MRVRIVSVGGDDLIVERMPDEDVAGLIDELRSQGPDVITLSLDRGRASHVLVPNIARVDIDPERPAWRRLLTRLRGSA